MTLIQQIIEWAKDKPAWERDLIRRVFENGDLNSSDKRELITLIKKDHGLIEDSELTAKPIEEYFPAENSTSSRKVYIEKLHRVKNVNRLKEGEELSFNKNGLTIIYGENASGKSGYSRVLKRACRARHIGRILPNVYQENNEQTPEAVFQIEFNDTPMSEIWRDIETPSDRLTCISVFDKHCARIYVNEKNQIDYLPYGADILPKLISAIEEFKEHFENNEKSDLPIFSEELKEALQEIGIDDLENQLNEEEFKKLQKLSLTEDEKVKLKSLKETFLQRQANSPEKRAASMRRLKLRLERLKTALENMMTSLSDEKIREILKMYSDYQDAKKTAEVASKTNFSNEPLDGIGSETWRAMFEAARKYSETEAYKDLDFPVVGDDSHCVLCQQKLDDSAKTRLKKFDDFVKDKTSKKAKESKEKLEKAYKDIDELDFNILPDDSEIKTDIMQNHPELEEKIMAFVSAGETRKNALKQYFQNGGDFTYPELAQSDIVEIFGGKIEELDKRIEDCESAKKSKEEIEEEKSFRELSNRQIVAKNLETIEKYVASSDKNKKVQKCISTFNTRVITSKQKELLKEAVTDRLFTALQEELNELGVENIELEPIEEGEKGNISLQISLKGVKTNIRELADVLSEGEERMVAIGSFLAELKIYEHLSCIVFDDPVSSLDHKWRTKVAERIVKEAKSRQVVVFTHDLVFLLDLQAAAENEFLEDVHVQALESNNSFSGLVAENPSAVFNTKGQVGMLKVMQQKSKMIHDNQGTEQYNEYIERCYSKLRSAWEKCIEEVVLNHTVSRFRYGIETRRLKDVATKINTEDYDKIEAAMSKCSSVTDAHDTAAAARGSVPSPDDFKKDIDTLEDFVKEFRERK